MIRLCVVAPLGRMGAQVLSLADSRFAVKSVLVRDTSSLSPSWAAPLQDQEILITQDPAQALAEVDIYVDFSTPDLSAELATLATRTQTAAVVGTTGLHTHANQALAQLATCAPVLTAANFSPGIALLLHLARQSAEALGTGFDLEIVELHHRNKVDSPSGTALALGEAMAQGRGIDFSTSKKTAREGQVGPRADEEIGLVAVRGGDIVGEHTAFFIGAEERIEITHRAQKRSVFANGALRAAAWTFGKSPGQYQMTDVLGV